MSLVSAVLMEEEADGVRLTFTLEWAALAAISSAAHAQLSVTLKAGGQLRQFAIRYDQSGATRVHVFDFGSATQANAGSVTARERTVIGWFPDTSLGSVESATAIVNINGDDVEQDIAVTVLPR